MGEQVEHPLAVKRGWKLGVDYPVWGNNPLYLTTIQGGYLTKDETPNEAYKRLAKTASRYQSKLEIDNLEDEFYNILNNGWLIPSTPVMSNFGTERGLPISCFSGVVGDDMYDIYRKITEMAMLSKHGGGTAYDFSKVRPIGAPIKGGLNGTSDGIIPFIKSYDSTILACKQGSMRRGAVAIYLNAEHKEYKEFLEIREPKGDVNRQCHNLHQGGIFTDAFMQEVVDVNGAKRELWKQTLMKRVKTGEPYTFFIDNANKNLPAWWQLNNLVIRHSNLCTEIMLPTDENHTLVCCLSSLNAAKYDEWKDTKTVFFSILFLDAVISEFLDKTKDLRGMEDAVRFAEKSRALGLGLLGYHTYLQSKFIPFVGIQANSVTRLMFGGIRKQAEEATMYMGNILGSPLWCEGIGRRNLTLLAIAPNRSSSKLAGGLSQGVEPIAANVYMDDDAKGLHIRRNIILEEYLQAIGMNTNTVWDQITEDKGSVANVKDLSDDAKEVFRTFKEINQLELVRQAAIREQYLDQGQSINLAFFQDATAKWINQVHIEAWKLGLKSLYYLRSESVLRADSKQQRDLYSECLMCEG
jgi:ribonucleoside-diphosphate reductase alpha chain